MMIHTHPTQRATRRLTAATATLALTSAGLVGLGAAPALAAPSPICGTFERAPVNGDELVIQNNAWGETSRQCVAPREGGFTITEAQGDIEFGGAPKSYPSILVGEHHGSGSDSDYLPVKVSDVASNVRTSAKVTMAEGRYNVAYDWWVNSSPDSPGQNDDTEIMVWVNEKGGPSPIGKKVGVFSFEGRTYDVWVGNIGWDVISFVDVEGTTSPDLALRPFLDEAVKRGVTGAENYLTSVQFGFEPWEGGEGLAVDDFTFGPSAERPARTTKQPAKDTSVDPSLTSTSAPKPKRPDDGYDQVALADDPALLITGPDQGDEQSKDDSEDKDNEDEEAAGWVRDLADPDREVAVHGVVATTTTPDGSTAAVLDATGGYLEVEDSPDQSIATTGQLTVEMLLRPDAVNDMPGAEDSSDGEMVQPLIKGSTFGSDGDQEWAMRLYDANSTRPGRTSAYAFNPAGGQGAGSYAQDDLEQGQWVHLAAVYDTTTDGGDGWGTVTLYRDGVQRDVDSLGEKYRITPADGDSPLFIGGDPKRSLFFGAIGAVAIYPTALSDERIAAHADAALGDEAGNDTGNDPEEAGKDSGKSNQDKGSGDSDQQPEREPVARPIPIPTQPSPTTGQGREGR